MYDWLYSNVWCPCPETLDFYYDVVTRDDANTIIDFIAYCLWREYRFHNWMLFNGSGQNGKSTMLKHIARLLGQHNVSSENLQRLLERPFSSAQLYGKLANIDADLSAEALKNTGLLKKLTGDDKLTAEHKHRPPFEFTNKAKLIFSANELPPSNDVTDAFFRRLIIINFIKQYFADKDPREDPYLFNKITTDEELTGFIHLLVGRIPRVLKDGIRKTTNEAIVKTQERYIMSTDPVEFFVSKAINKDPDVNSPKEIVYESFSRMCRHFGLPIMSPQKFSQTMKSKGFEYDEIRDKKIRGNKFYAWLGVKVSDWLIVEDKDQQTLDEDVNEDGQQGQTPQPQQQQGQGDKEDREPRRPDSNLFT